MLTRGSTAKILARQQDTGPLIALLIENKIWVNRPIAVIHSRFALIKIAPLVKGVRAKAAALNRL